MPRAKLIVNNEREVEIGEGVTSIGRTPDNNVSLSTDSNVSRYHAEIETRGGEFWLFELGSSNGTTLNGERVYSEKLLKDGDLIVLGGTSELLFEIEKEAAIAAPDQAPAADGFDMPAAAAVPVTPPPVPVAPAAAAVETPKAASKMPMMLAIAGIVCGLAVICVVAAVFISIGGGSKCEAKATITSPENGETIIKETEIEIEAENADCAKRAIFLLDGVEIASAAEAPYTVSLDPKQLSEFSDGGEHTLNVVFEDEEGNKIQQPGEGVQLAFETLATPAPTPEPTETPVEKPAPKKPEGKLASLQETQEMSRRLLKEFSVNQNYKFDQQFLQEVQKRTAEYTSEGYFARAQPFQDLINVEFHKENGLDPPLGFILAMSRSKFNPQKQGADEGLWRLTDNFVTGNNYKASCLTDSLSAPQQTCAAKTTAIYVKSLVLKIFNGDLIYAVSAFGLSEGEASQWQSTLPPDRTDFWRVIKTPQQREQIVRFFAAGIVAENPQRFGLKKDRPISDLYKNLMSK